MKEYAIIPITVVAVVPFPSKSNGKFRPKTKRKTGRQKDKSPGKGTRSSPSPTTPSLRATSPFSRSHSDSFTRVPHSRSNSSLRSSSTTQFDQSFILPVEKIKAIALKSLEDAMNKINWKEQMARARSAERLADLEEGDETPHIPKEQKPAAERKTEKEEPQASDFADVVKELMDKKGIGSPVEFASSEQKEVPKLEAPHASLATREQARKKRLQTLAAAVEAKQKETKGPEEGPEEGHEEGHEEKKETEEDVSDFAAVVHELLDKQAINDFSSAPYSDHKKRLDDPDADSDTSDSDGGDGDSKPKKHARMSNFMNKVLFRSGDLSKHLSEKDDERKVINTPAQKRGRRKRFKARFDKIKVLSRMGLLRTMGVNPVSRYLPYGDGDGERSEMTRDEYLKRPWSHRKAVKQLEDTNLKAVFTQRVPGTVFVSHGELFKVAAGMFSETTWQIQLNPSMVDVCAGDICIVTDLTDYSIFSRLECFLEHGGGLFLHYGTNVLKEEHVPDRRILDSLDLDPDLSQYHNAEVDRIPGAGYVRIYFGDAYAKSLLNFLQILAGTPKYNVPLWFPKREPESPFPVTYGNSLELYQDGKDAIDHMIIAMSQAKKYILVTGWDVWFDLPLQRDPVNILNHLNLGQLLNHKHRTGVIVKVVAWAGYGQFAALGGLQTDFETKMKEEKTNKTLEFEVLSAAREKWDNYGNQPSNYYSNHQKTVLCDSPIDGKCIAFIGGVDLARGRYDTGEHQLTPNADGYSGEKAMTTIVRLPWHDIHAKVTGPITKNIVTNFYQRYSKAGGDLNNLPNFSLSEFERVTGLKTDYTMQLFRSMVDRDHLECGIHKAYLEAIKEAKHFIYIETQYFISQAPGHSTFREEVDNQISTAISGRIVKAIEENKKFYVYLLLPMWPDSMDGPGDNGGSLVRRLQFESIVSIYMAAHEAIKKFERKTNPRDYFGVYSLFKRESNTHFQLPKRPSSRQKAVARSRAYQIYIHSKLMIVDDEYIILGSANLNERSLAGYRDSEICFGAVAHEGKSELIHKLRKNLWAEHLGSTEAEAEKWTNAADPETKKLMDEYATQNSYTLTNTMEDLPHGHLIHYPLLFQSKEKGKLHIKGGKIPFTNRNIGKIITNYIPDLFEFNHTGLDILAQ